VRSVHLDHSNTSNRKVTSQTGSVGAGGFHPDPVDWPEPRQPIEQALVARCSCRELAITKAYTPILQGDCVMSVLVRIDSAGDPRLVL